MKKHDSLVLILGGLFLMSFVATVIVATMVLNQLRTTSGSIYQTAIPIPSTPSPIIPEVGAISFRVALPISLKNHAGGGSMEVVNPTETPILPGAPIPIPSETPVHKEYVDMEFSEALRMGWIEITIFAPWGAELVFEFQPVEVDFDSLNFGNICPYWGTNACFETFDTGAYIMTHSQAAGAVAEQARNEVEGLLLRLAVINDHLISLNGAGVEVKLANGQYVRARVTQVQRIVGQQQIYVAALNRYTDPGTMVLEFCGYPHIEDGTAGAGTTGAVYKITIEGDE